MRCNKTVQEKLSVREYCARDTQAESGQVPFDSVKRPHCRMIYRPDVACGDLDAA